MATRTKLVVALHFLAAVGRRVPCAIVAISIKLLVALHFVALPVLAAAARRYTWPNPALIIVLAVAAADSGLLGIWAAFGRTGPRLRSATVITALLALWGCLVVADGYNTPTDEVVMDLIVISLPAAIVFLVLNRLRFGKRRLSLTRAAPLPARDERLQFSIRHLLIATTAVAVLLAGGKAVQSVTGMGRWRNYSLAIAVVVPCFVMVQLAAAWAALGLGRPARRLFAVVTSGFMLGLVPAFYIDSDMFREMFPVWSSITGLQSVISTASLLVVRTCGWRLCQNRSVSELSQNAKYKSKKSKWRWRGLWTLD